MLPQLSKDLSNATAVVVEQRRPSKPQVPVQVDWTNMATTIMKPETGLFKKLTWAAPMGPVQGESGGLPGQTVRFNLARNC